MSTQGQLVTETFDFDGGRQVTAWLPAAPPRAVVYAGDGQLIPHWGDFALAAGAPPTMIVGVHRLAERTADFGVSAGGELALALGLAHPDFKAS